MSGDFKRARQVILLTNADKDQIDATLNAFGISHRQYRRHYPDTPSTLQLALDVLDALDNGMKRKDIQLRWHLSDAQYTCAVYHDIERLGCAPALNKRGLVLTALRSDEKLTQQQIADKCGVTQSCVHKIAKEHGLTPERKTMGKLSDQDVEDIREALANGEHKADLAAKYGVVRDTINKRLRASA